jgi:hypothetical protein
MRIRFWIRIHSTVFLLRNAIEKVTCSIILPELPHNLWVENIDDVRGNLILHLLL